MVRGRGVGDDSQIPASTVAVLVGEEADEADHDAGENIDGNGEEVRRVDSNTSSLMTLGKKSENA